MKYKGFYFKNVAKLEAAKRAVGEDDVLALVEVYERMGGACEKVAEPIIETPSKIQKMKNMIAKKVMKKPVKKVMKKAVKKTK